MIRWALVHVLVAGACTGATGRGPSPRAEQRDRVRVELDGFPVFAVDRARMEEGFGKLLREVERVLAIEAPPPPPEQGAEGGRWKAWLAERYLPYVQAHTKAHGRVVARLSALREADTRLQVIATALLGWLGERDGRVRALNPMAGAMGDDPFESARSHYQVCMERARAEDFDRWETFCRERLDALPPPQRSGSGMASLFDVPTSLRGTDSLPAPAACLASMDAMARRLDALEADRPGPAPRWVTRPRAPAGKPHPAPALSVSITPRWVVFLSFRGRTDAEATPRVMGERLAKMAAEHRQQAKVEQVDLLVFADRSLTVGRLTPLVHAASQAGRPWLAFGAEPSVVSAPVLAERPAWYAPWRTEVWNAASTRSDRIHALRDGLARLLRRCPSAQATLRALPAVDPVSRWGVFRRLWTAEVPKLCTCDRMRGPAFEALFELGAAVLLGPPGHTRRVRLGPLRSLHPARTDSGPVRRDTTLAELASALEPGDAPLVLPSMLARPPE